MKKLNISQAFASTAMIFILCSFVAPVSLEKYPSCITRISKTTDSGKELIQTEILIDKTTSREDLIHTCQFLAKEKINLTFESLKVSRPFLGLLGKSRIVGAKGEIQLPNYSNEVFEVGGSLGFKYLKITFSKNTSKDVFYFNMVEVVD
ncbi:MAG: hypothetical protein RIG68_23210 [Imperialibacter sp.]|uniref:hypothetical protein n=1 Tax=Imperialibacter sp. TaxID=2038411 RepID=UPI0032F079EB